jgi:hypothetical protein
LKVHPAAFLILVAAAGSLLVLQGIFDRADLDKSEKLVREYRLGPTTLGEFIERRHDDRSGPVRWSSELLSSCRGTVRVTCEVPRRAKAAVYRFDVDLPQKGIHPGDAAGKDVLEALERASFAPLGP